MDKKSFSLPEIANILGISRQRVHELVKKNRIKAEFVGKMYIVKASDLQEFINSRKS